MVCCIEWVREAALWRWQVACLMDQSFHRYHSSSSVVFCEAFLGMTLAPIDLGNCWGGIWCNSTRYSTFLFCCLLLNLHCALLHMTEFLFFFLVVWDTPAEYKWIFISSLSSVSILGSSHSVRLCLCVRVCPRCSWNKDEGEEGSFGVQVQQAQGRWPWSLLRRASHLCWAMRRWPGIIV